jgi:hypothetical protein
MLGGSVFPRDKRLAIVLNSLNVCNWRGSLRETICGGNRPEQGSDFEQGVRQTGGSSIVIA